MKLRERDLSGLTKQVQGLNVNINDLNDPNSVFMLKIKKDLEAKRDQAIIVIGEIHAERSALKSTLDDKILKNLEWQIELKTIEGTPEELKAMRVGRGNTIENELVRAKGRLEHLEELLKQC